MVVYSVSLMLFLHILGLLFKPLQAITDSVNRGDLMGAILTDFLGVDKIDLYGVLISCKI